MMLASPVLYSYIYSQYHIPTIMHYDMSIQLSYNTMYCHTIPLYCHIYKLVIAPIILPPVMFQSVPSHVTICDIAKVMGTQHHAQSFMFNFFGNKSVIGIITKET